MYKVTIYFKDGTKLEKSISEYDYACSYTNRAWEEFDNVIKSELKEDKE